MTTDNKRLLWTGAGFILLLTVPWSNPLVLKALQEAFLMFGEYAREHVLLCLVPAFFIAGAIMIFLNQQAIIHFLGPDAPKIVSYSVASVSGAVLAVCSCTVLPLFKGIYRKGAGLGPAVSFLYSEPAINILAMISTTKVLGFRLGIARAVGAVVFAFIIGLLMHLIFRNEDRGRNTNATMFQSMDARSGRTTLLIGSLVAFLIFANWAPSGSSVRWWNAVYTVKWIPATASIALLGFTVLELFSRSDRREWLIATRTFAVQVTPLLFFGVLLAGFLLGRPGERGFIPESWIVQWVGI